MANESQIKVDLQAQVDEAQVRNELKKLQDIVSKSGKAAIGETVSDAKIKSVRKDADAVETAENKKVRSVKKTTSALNEQLIAWRKLGASVEAGLKVTFSDKKTNTSAMSPERQAQLAQLKSQRAQGLRGYNAQEFFRNQPAAPPASSMSAERQAELNLLKSQRAQGLRGYNAQEFFRNQPTGTSTQSGLATRPNLNPPTPPAPARPATRPAAPSATPPVIGALPTAGRGAAASAMNRGMVGAAIGAAGGGAVTGAIGGLLMAAGPAAIAIAAVTAAVVAMKAAIQKVIEAFNRAASLYAKSITSGVGVGMAQKKGQLASTLGVSEDEIFQFGAAIQYLNEKIEVSSKVLASNVSSLSAVAWESRALGDSIDALWSELASGMAGPIQDAVAGIRLFIDTLLQTDVIKGIGVALGAVFTILEKTMELLMIGVNVIILSFQALADGLTWLAVQVNNFLASISGGLLATEIDDSGLFEGTKKGFEGLTKQVDNFWSGASNKKVPEPQAQMKQMPASSWEKMGLVIGGGGGTNYAQQTAKNTEKSNSLLGKIANALANPKNSGDKLSFTSVPSTP